MRGGRTRQRIATAGAALMATILAMSGQAAAYTNLSGVWQATYFEDWPDRLPGPELGDFGGLPLNDHNLMRAKSWSASLIALPEYQCRTHPSDYANSFANIRIWEEFDEKTQELVAIHLLHFAWNTERTIWMDGREHPPEYAEHTTMGFSTGKWNGHILEVTTTHLKEGWLRRNGVARSDQATVTEHFIRHGGDLNWTVYIQDPVYLEEPFIRNRDYKYTEHSQIAPYTCESVVEIDRPETYIPHHLPGQNPYIEEFAQRRRLPVEAAMGGAETMYPEYMEEMREMPLPPEYEAGE